MPLTREIRPDAVAIYIRWSTDEQTDGTTLETQQERTSLYVQSQGWQVNPELVFIDDGYSGGNLDRPALGRLRRAVADGRVDCVVTYKLDRLSRNLVDTVTLVRQEWAGRCIYRSATEGFDTSHDSPTGSLIFNILASFAEFERAVIRERTYSGLLRRMKEGMYISGVAPYGYQRAEEKGQLAISSRAADGTLTDQAAVVAHIFDLATGNLARAPAAIARALNQQGIPAPAGGPWWASSVERILRNPVYAGHVVYGRRAGTQTGRRLAAAISVPDKVPAIIPTEQFEAAQRYLSARPGAKPKGHNRAREDYLLTALARCRCGGPIGAVKDRYGNLYYRCGRRSKGVGCSAGCKAFRATLADDSIGRAVKERFANEKLKERALEYLARQASAEQRLEQIAHGLREVERRQEKVRADLHRLLRQARQGELSPRTYEEFRADAEREMRDLAEQANRLQAERETAAASHLVVDQFRAAMASVDEWYGLEPAERKQLLRLLLQRLTVFSSGSGIVDMDIDWVV